MTQRQCNILNVYRLATACEIDNGRKWYTTAHEGAKRIHPHIRIGAAVIAAVSPGLRWEQNVECASRIIRKRSLAGLGVRWYDGVKKAKRIIKGHNPQVVLRGNKVRAFYACLLDPANKLHACIDGHAFAIWAGRRITLDSTPKINNRLYNRIVADYCIVAKSLRLKPNQLQAITWLAWRRLHEVTRLAA